ncbi:MAG: class I SAM-dependent methyltransferase [Krumholzibacteria bacterium]|nr:class I SAM-dependent methyltransferase [Candidatus Krumholzibacteria bacterium]
MPVLSFVRTTLLDPLSPACLWRHPVMAARVLLGATENSLLPLGERLAGRRPRRCPVCHWQGHRFRNFLSADEVIRHCICPSCGSFDRHRLLVLGVRGELRRLGHQAPDVIVGFSLSTAMRYVLEHEGLARCYRSDIDAQEKRFDPDFTADLRQAPLRDGSVDWIFCSHVLEHIPQLELCVDEILRILRPGGAAWIQVPLEPGLAHSRRIPVDPHRAHAHAWQFAPDFPHLIARPGWAVTEHVAADEVAAGELRRCAIDRGERYWLARKHA